MKHFITVAAIGFYCALTLPTGAAEPAPQEPSAQQKNLVETAYPGLAAGVLTYAQLAELPEGVLLQSGDLKFTREDLQKAIAAAPKPMQKQLNQNAFFVMEQEVTPKLIVKTAQASPEPNDPASQPKTEQDIINAYVARLTEKIEVTGADIEKFYQENESIFCGTPLEKVKDQIGPFVLKEKKQQRITEHLKTLGQNLDIRVSAGWAEKQSTLAKENPLDQARTNGKVTLAVFSAASCCGPDKMKPVLAELEGKHDTGKLNLLYLEAKQEQVLAARYQVRSIPTQIFFDKTGREVYRHVGFFSTEDIEKQLAQFEVQ